MSDRSLAVLAPVLNRPDAIGPLAESLVDSVASEIVDGWQVGLIVICSPEDRTTFKVCEAAGLEPFVVGWPAGPGDYSRKINLAARTMFEREAVEYVLLGADDLRFHDGWLTAAVRRHRKTGCPVIGTNDLGNPAVMRGRHATHSLVHRSYLEQGTWDEPGKLLHEGYGHCWVDNEFVETAQARSAFAFARDSHVEHLHPIWHKGTDDETYRRGQESYQRDHRLYLRRREMWRRRGVPLHRAVS